MVPNWERGAVWWGLVLTALRVELFEAIVPVPDVADERVSSLQSTLELRVKVGVAADEGLGPLVVRNGAAEGGPQQLVDSREENDVLHGVNATQNKHREYSEV